MRFKLRFEVEHEVNQLSIVPFDYQRRLSAWIYDTLAKADQQYAEWLHNQGYRSADRFYKYFTFSPLFIARKKILPEEGIHVQGDRVTLILSFAATEIEYHFIAGLFQEAHMYISNNAGQVRLKVIQVERLPDPEFTDKMEFETISPVFLSRARVEEGRGRNRHAEHISPGHPDYERLFADNLMKKHRYWHGQDSYHPEDVKLEVLNQPRSKMITAKYVHGKPIRNRAFHFNFRLHAPAEVMRTGYYAGFGGQNAQGFGCVEIASVGGTEGRK